MPIDPDVAIGASTGEKTFRWSESDVLLYHLAIGAGSEPGSFVSPTSLRYTFDDDALQVLPSFAVVAPTFHETDPPPLDLPGCDINLAQVVHGAQEITVHGPVPTSGEATLRTRITDIWDKGKAAVIWQEGTAVDAAGRDLWTVRSSIFVRGEGGWGGDRGPSGGGNEPPDRAPDHEVTVATRPDQALLYRLSGDRNPLHSDPAFAAMGGFDRPILHGLCTYGFTGRVLLHELCGSDPARFRSMDARFSSPVMPGESLTVKAWVDGEGSAIFQTCGQDGRVVIDNGRVTFS